MERFGIVHNTNIYENSESSEDYEYLPVKFDTYPNSFINDVTALGKLMHIMGVIPSTVDYLETRSWWLNNTSLQIRVYSILRKGGANLINGCAPDFSEHILFCEDYLDNKDFIELWLSRLVENIQKGHILLELDWFKHNNSVLEWIWQIKRISSETNIDGLSQIDIINLVYGVEEFISHLIDIYHKLF